MISRANNQKLLPRLLACTRLASSFCVHIPSTFATQPTRSVANMKGKKRAAPAAEQPDKVSLSSHHCRHLLIARAMLTLLTETQEIPKSRAARYHTSRHSLDGYQGVTPYRTGRHKEIRQSSNFQCVPRSQSPSPYTPHHPPDDHRSTAPRRSGYHRDPREDSGMPSSANALWRSKSFPSVEGPDRSLAAHSGEDVSTSRR